jgi:hypothetical protein
MLLETFKDVVNILYILFFIYRVDKDIIKIYNINIINKIL